jgi:hypothetical protein
MIWRAAFTIACLLIGAPVFVAGAPSPRPPQSEARLLARIQEERNPVKKSKEEARLARLKLRQAIHTYGQGDVEQGAQLVSAYLGRIKDAWQTISNSGRNAARDSRGFKELDIELREDVRLLEDLKRRVSYSDRDPIEKAEKEVEQARAEVLKALFPAARPQGAAKPFVGRD